MINGSFQDRLRDVSPSAIAMMILGVLFLSGLLATRYSLFEAALPGVPKLRGYPVVGAIPIYFRDGMSLMLETLTKIGEDGISYARVGNKTLVSVHDPAMVKEVLNIPDGVASRYVTTMTVSQVLTTLGWETLGCLAGHPSGLSLG
jgi:hypothetical protein